MLDEISFLVQETFKDAEKLGQNFFNRNKESIPESSGLFFNIQKKSSTFVVRILASENLKKDHKNILKHPNMFPALRLSQTEEEISEELSYFGVSSFEQAQKIREQIGNKRFPINEEHIFNLSDPGDTWWLESTDSSFNFYFNLAHVDRIESLTKLGPLGDSKSCLEFFGQLHGYFKQIFPLDKYSCGQGQVSVQAKDNTSLMFRYILDAFRSGEINTELREYLTSLEENSPNFEVRSSFQKANIFLSDLIVTRKFWKLIESKL